MTSITVPPNVQFAKAAGDFRDFATGLTDAAAVLNGIAVEPGEFPEATSLQEHVEAFCRVRTQTLQVYSDVAGVMADIVEMVGGQYTVTERRRVDGIHDISSQLTDKLAQLEKLHKNLTAIKSGESVTMPPRHGGRVPVDTSTGGQPIWEINRRGAGSPSDRPLLPDSEGAVGMPPTSGFQRIDETRSGRTLHPPVLRK